MTDMCSLHLTQPFSGLACIRTGMKVRGSGMISYWPILGWHLPGLSCLFADLNLCWTVPVLAFTFSGLYLFWHLPGQAFTWAGLYLGWH
jgi:hypothetical protein